MYIVDDPTTYSNDKTSSKCKKYVKLADGKLFGSWLGFLRIIPARFGTVKRETIRFFAIPLHHLIFLSKLKLTILTSLDLIEEIRPHKYSKSPFFSSPQGTENIDAYSPNITRLWKLPATCSFAYNTNNNNNHLPNSRNHYVTESDLNIDKPFIDDYDNNIIEGAARSKVSRSSATESMGLSGVKSFRMYSLDVSILIVFSIFITAFRIS